MADDPEEGNDVDWRTVIDLLRDGKPAEIPCAHERDCMRRAKQAGKRAERRGIPIEVIRGEGVVRIEPRPAAAAGSGPEEA